MVESKIKFDYWACARPLTSKWGSGQVFNRISKELGMPTAAFGKTDQIPDGVAYYDLSNGYNWLKLPLEDNSVEFGYWDPPYENRLKNGYRKTMMFKNEGREIWRVCRRLAILHTHVWPHAWLNQVAYAEREAMIAITMGPMKQIRLLQVFRKVL